MKIGDESLVIGDEKPGYEGYYCVRMTQTQNGPYKCVQLSRDGGSETIRVDKLVARAFLGMQIGMAVAWIDGDRSNACLCNLVLYKGGQAVPDVGYQYVESDIYAKAISGDMGEHLGPVKKHPIYGVRWFCDGDENLSK